MSDVVIYDVRALNSAFMAYVGTTRHCAGVSRSAQAAIRQAIYVDSCGVTRVERQVWVRAMTALRKLPYGGRWVHQARMQFERWLDKALTKENDDERRT